MKTLETMKMKGLNTWQIKMLAVVFMTIDHLGAYGFEIPIFDAWYSELRLIGRIAMPLFLFALTEGVRHTRSRKKMLLRLYLAAVGCGLFVAVTNFLFDDSVGMFISSNIFFTYFYVVLYIVLVEEILTGCREKNRRRILIGFGGIAATVIPHILLALLYEVNVMEFGASLDVAFLYQDLVASFLASPLVVEYSILFVIMGVVMYFAGSKTGKAAVLVAFSILCYLGGKIPAISGSMWLPVGYPQYYMILAAPFILLYNGEKGRSSKYFFYCYYPLHRYAISVAVYLYEILSGA